MFKHFALAATFAVLASSAAANPNRYMYAGVDLGSTDMDGFSQKESSGGAFVGYRFNRHVAIEGSYRRLGKFDYTDGGKPVTQDQYAFTAIGSLALSPRASLFGRAGISVQDTDRPTYGGFGSHNRKSLSILGGVGLSYDFTPAITGRVEFQRASGVANNLSAALAFAF
jgi:opacity protein-like surface antigen